MADRLKELRIKYAASLSTAYTDPGTGGGYWDNGDTGVIKLAATNLDLSGLDYQSIESKVLTQNLLENNRPIVGPRSGNLKFSAYLGNGSADGVEPKMCTLISKVFGGTPPTVTTQTYALDDTNAGATHTTTVIYIDTDVTSYLDTTQAVQVGVSGDGRGGGEIRSISSITTTGSTATAITLSSALPGTPADADNVYFTHAKSYTLNDANSGGPEHSVSVLYVDGDKTAHFIAGMCVLVGARGDSRGDGQVRRIASSETVSSSTAITLDLALPAAPADDDVIILSHTAWIDTDNTQSYIDWLALGEHANNAFQGIGSMGPMTISGLGVGEIPSAEFDMKASAWRWIPNGDFNAIDPDTASVGEPAPSQCEGLFIMGINGTVTYDAAQKMAVGNIGIDPGITFDEIPGLNGNNGIQGFKKTMVAPKFSGTILLEDAVDAGGNYDDLVNDYIEANTSSEISRNIVIQFGHTAQNCIAFTFPKCHLTAMPKPAAINNLQGVAVEFAGTRTGGTAGACVDSSFAIHWF